MSVTLTGANKQRGPNEGPLNLTLNTICDEADDFGFACPSIESIAHGSRCSKRQVIRRIQLLEKQGWLRVERKVFRGDMANAYFVNIEKLGVVPNAKARRSPLWTNVQRLLRALESRDKVSLLNGVLKFEKTPESIELAASGDLFGEDSGSDTMTPENVVFEPQKSANHGGPAPIAAKTVEKPDGEPVNGESAGDMVSRDMCRPRHVTSDNEGEPFNVLPIINPLQTTTTPNPASGAEGKGPVLAALRPDQPNFELSVGVAARWVMKRAGLTGRSLERVIGPQLKLWVERTDGGLDDAARLMVTNLAEYRRLGAAGLLRVRYGVPNFVKQGLWCDQASWQVDATNAALTGVSRETRPAEADAELEARWVARARVYLDGNAAALDAVGDYPALAERLRAIDVAAVPHAVLAEELEGLDQELVQLAVKAAPEEELARYRAEAMPKLAHYRGKMKPEAFEHITRQYVTRAVMAARKLPKLSLFYMPH